MPLCVQDNFQDVLRLADKCEFTVAKASVEIFLCSSIANELTVSRLTATPPDMEAPFGFLCLTPSFLPLTTDLLILVKRSSLHRAYSLLLSFCSHGLSRARANRDQQEVSACTRAYRAAIHELMDQPAPAKEVALDLVQQLLEMLKV